MMNKHLTFLIGILIVQAMTTDALAANQVTAYFFWSDGCPHCEAEKIVLSELEEKYPTLEIKSFQVSGNRDNMDLYSELASAYGFKPTEVPTIFIGEWYIVGYSNSKTNKIKVAINHCATFEECIDPITKISGGITPPGPATERECSTDADCEISRGPCWECRPTEGDCIKITNCNTDNDCSSRYGPDWVCMDKCCVRVIKAATTTSPVKTTKATTSTKNTIPTKGTTTSTRRQTTSTSPKTTTTTSRIQPTTTMEPLEGACSIDDPECGDDTEDDTDQGDQQAFTTFLLIAGFCLIFVIAAVIAYLKGDRGEEETF